MPLRPQVRIILLWGNLCGPKIEWGRSMTKWNSLLWNRSLKLVIFSLAGTCSEDITLQRACKRIQRRKEAECMSRQMFPVHCWTLGFT